MRLTTFLLSLVLLVSTQLPSNAVSTSFAAYQSTETVMGVTYDTIQMDYTITLTSSASVCTNQTFYTVDPNSVVHQDQIELPFGGPTTKVVSFEKIVSLAGVWRCSASCRGNTYWPPSEWTAGSTDVYVTVVL